MHIVIAGGAGFIGSHMTRRYLEQGHEVTIVDSFVTGRRENVEALERTPHGRRLRMIREDIRERFDVAGPVDAVINLASPASPIDYLRHPIETLQTGSQGTQNLLELACRHGARFLLASTSEVYGDPAVHPQPESYWGNVNPIGPRSVYDEAKRYAEALASAYARQGLLVVRIARIFNTYGPAMRLDDGRVIPTFVGQALGGEPLTVHGDGSQTRSYCFVSDLVRGLEGLLWSDVEVPVNLGNDEEFTVLDTAHRIIAMTESSSAVVHRPMPEDDPKRRRPELTRARTRLGWWAQVPFEAGLRETVEDLAKRLQRGERSGVSPEAQTWRPWIRTPAAADANGHAAESGTNFGA